MARLINKLSAIGIARLKRKGLHGDGGGLYLRVSSSGGKFWVFRYMVYSKAHEMGLGALHAVSLAEARRKAQSYRSMLTDGKNPLEIRRKLKAKSQLLKAKEKTFKECAEAYIRAHKSGWRNPKHRQQWNSTLAHATGNKVEAAYRRSDFFEKRRQMMNAWARYCAMPSVKNADKKSNVTAIGKITALK